MQPDSSPIKQATQPFLIFFVAFIVWSVWMIYSSILSTFSKDGPIWWHNITASLDLAFINGSWFSALALFSLLILILLIASFLMSQIIKWEKQHHSGIVKERENIYGLQRPSVNLNDIVIPEEVKKRMRELLEPSTVPHLQKIRAPMRNIIISGPAGCGKSLIAYAIAGEAGATLLHVKTSELVEALFEKNPRAIQLLFSKAWKLAPTVILLDDLDLHDQDLDSWKYEKFQDLLIDQIQMLGSEKQVIIIATARDPTRLAPILLSPAGIPTQIHLDLPDLLTREQILMLHTHGLRFTPNTNLSLIARTTAGFSGADLKELCNRAASNAAQEGRHQVCMADFEESLDRMLLKIGQKHLLRYDEQT